MRAALLLIACCSTKAPPLGDTDATRPLVIGTPADGGAIDTGSDSGVTAFYTDYEGLCTQGRPIWRYHDFQTKTPGGSAIVFSAQSAAAPTDFANAQGVELAKVTGPDITVWTGVDVDPKLKTKGEQSLRYLRITTTLIPGPDAQAPTLVGTRQQYDCIQNQ